MRGGASEIFTRFKPPQRSRGAIIVALIAHALVVFALASIVFRYPIKKLLALPDYRNAPPPERVQFVKVAPVAGGDSTASPTARPAVPPAAGAPPRGEPTPAQTAPTTVPTTLPPVSSGGSPDGVAGGTGGGGAARGVTPEYGDPRIWVSPGPFVPLPRTAAMRADSLVREAFGVYADSVAIANANPQRAPGDWTVEKGGQKWGVDPKWIHVGKVKIPTAVLAMLPINAQGNPTELARSRSQGAIRRDIHYQASRSVNEDEFRQAVKRIRERKERERREAAKDRPLP